MARSSETLSPALPDDVEQLALDLLRAATKRDLTIATAESCTGGLLASLLTDVEGCGHCFERGFVTYTDQSKTELLGVPAELLSREGAVSRPTAQAMIEGALNRSQAQLAAAITGYAGRGEEGAEPGLVYIATGRRDLAIQVAEFHFGDVGRGEVRLQCLRAALKAMLELVRSS